MDDIRVSVTERDEALYCKAKNNVRRGEVLFSLPLGICLDVNKAVTKFGQITAQLRTGIMHRVSISDLEYDQITESSTIQKIMLFSSDILRRQT